MKALYVTLTLLLLAASSFAQKIAVKGNLATVDRRPYVRIDADGSAFTMAGQRTFYVSSPTGERLLVVKELQFNDPLTATPNNVTGTVVYAQFLFPATRTVAELPVSGLGFERPIDIARTLYAAQLLRGTTLDTQATADFVAIHGTPYAARRQLLDQALLGRAAGY